MSGNLGRAWVEEKHWNVCIEKKKERSIGMNEMHYLPPLGDGGSGVSLSS